MDNTIYFPDIDMTMDYGFLALESNDNWISINLDGTLH